MTYPEAPELQQENQRLRARIREQLKKLKKIEALDEFYRNAGLPFCHGSGNCQPRRRLWHVDSGLNLNSPS